MRDQKIEKRLGGGESKKEKGIFMKRETERWSEIKEKRKRAGTDCAQNSLWFSCRAGWHGAGRREMRERERVSRGERV